jgi:hypothetical protein
LQKLPQTCTKDLPLLSSIESTIVNKKVEGQELLSGMWSHCCTPKYSDL